MNKPDQKILLLVEDDAILASAQAYALEGFGYKVLKAGTAERAINLVLTNPEIDLILMDIDLGEKVDGTEAAKVILQNRDLPLIFLSSHTDRETVSKTEKITSYGYVVKNSSSTVLDASIKMAFRLFYAKQKTKLIEDDLRTHQIELEMQNNEFRNRQIELEMLRSKYFNVYHYSPVSQFTLSQTGFILEANLTASYLLGVLRNKLIQDPFTKYIHEEDQDKFYLYQKKIDKQLLAVNSEEKEITFMQSTIRESCELRLVHSSGAILSVYIVSTGLQKSPLSDKDQIYQLAVMQ